MRTPALLLATSLLAGACSTDTVSDDPEDSVFVDDSKADDFYSTSAQEYLLEGKSTVVLDASYAGKSDAERLAAAQKLIDLKQIAIAWFVTQYLDDKEDGDANKAFGGFGGMAKAGEYTDLGVTPGADGLTFGFTFRQLAAGGKNMMSSLPIHAAGGKNLFSLDIGKPTNEQLAQLDTNNEWYRQAPYGSWDPSKVAADQKETIELSIAKEKASSDGFFDIARLVEDGKLDVDIYFGWDYHDNFHLKHSSQFFTWLKDQGFTAPVASWDALTRTSGAFTRTLSANGKTIPIEVRLFFGKPGTETDPDTDAGGKLLEDDARHSLATRDVVMYEGHSGPFYGFALANWNKTTEGDLDDSDMRVIDMPKDRYQVVLAEACDTYQIGEAFKDNPNKAGQNIDVITTTSFSNAASPATTEDFLTAILAHDSAGRLRPQPVSTLLTKMDSESVSSGFHSMYGMHGIDDDPKLVPFANTAKFGKSCSANADCGGPGNLCVAKKCTAACTDTSGCGAGYTCKSVASASTSTIYGKACAKN